MIEFLLAVCVCAFLSLVVWAVIALERRVLG
jgi:hypothetical protein